MVKENFEVVGQTNVKKAAELTLDQLGLDEELTNYVRKRLCLKPDRLVLHCRTKALEGSKTRNRADRELEQKLIRAIDDAGYIRHDLRPTTYHVWRMYKDIDPCLTVRSLAIDNETYETEPAITPDDLDQIIRTMEGCLTQEEIEVLVAIYGLNSAQTLSCTKIARDKGVDKKEIKSLQKVALAKLRIPINLAMLPIAFGWDKRKYPDMELYRGIKKQASLDAPIEALHWSGKAYGYLKENKMDTLGNIYRASANKWAAQPEELQKEIEDNMHFAGYPDFILLNT